MQKGSRDGQKGPADPAPINASDAHSSVGKALPSPAMPGLRTLPGLWSPASPEVQGVWPSQQSGASTPWPVQLQDPATFRKAKSDTWKARSQDYINRF